MNKTAIIIVNLAVIIILILSTKIAEAARPFGTEEACIVEPKTLDFELGYNFILDEDDKTEHSLDFAFTTGLTDILDFGIVFPLVLHPEADLEEFEIGFKLFLIDFDPTFPVIAISFYYDLLNKTFTLNLISSLELNSFAIHANVLFGYEDNEQIEDIFVTSLLITYSEIEFIFGCEIIYEYNQISKESELIAVVGLSYELSDSCILDFGVPLNLRNIGNEFQFTIGINLMFNY